MQVPRVGPSVRLTLPCKEPRCPVTRQDALPEATRTAGPTDPGRFCRRCGRLATFSHRSPDQLRPAQMRLDLHHWLVKRHRAWRSCHRVAGGRRFFSTKTLGWEPLSLNLPPRTGRSQLPQGLSVAARQRLCTRAKHPRHRVLLMTPSAAGLRVSDVVRLRLTDSASARGLLRVEPGQGRQERSTLLSSRLRTALRADGQCDRPTPWVFTGRDPHTPMPLGTAQHISYHPQRRAGIRTATASRRGAIVSRRPGSKREPMSGRSRGCGAIRRSIPPHGTSGSPGSIWRRSAARSTASPAGTCPGPPGVTPWRPCPRLPPRDSRAHAQRPPWEVADLFRRYGEPYCRALLCHPRLSRGDVTSQPAGPHNAAGTPHGAPRGVARYASHACRNRHCPSARRGMRSSGSRPATLHGCRCPLSPWLSRAPRPHPPQPHPQAAPVDPAVQRGQPAPPPVWTAPPRRAARGPDGPADLGSTLGAHGPVHGIMAAGALAAPGERWRGRAPLPVAGAGLESGLSRPVLRGAEPGQAPPAPGPAAGRSPLGTPERSTSGGRSATPKQGWSPPGPPGRPGAGLGRCPPLYPSRRSGPPRRLDGRDGGCVLPPGTVGKAIGPRP